MKRLLLMVVLALAGCAREEPNGDRYYANNDEQLASGNGAFMTCTCLFVMEMPEDFCRAWVKANPNVAKLNIDWDRKAVESSVFISFSAKAHFIDDQRGCVLE